VVDGWSDRRPESRKGEAFHKRSDDSATLTESMKAVAAEMAQLDADPFRGSRQRRVMANDETPSDMEVAACEDAIRRAGVDRNRIKVLLQSSIIPDYIAVPNAGFIHHRLGLDKDCMSLSVDSDCTSFAYQMTLAERLINGGLTDYALVVQSIALTRIMPTEAEFSPFFGDVATAAIIGKVGKGRGLISRSSRTYGEHHSAFIAGCPGKRWWQSDGAVRAYVRDGRALRHMLLKSVDLSVEVNIEAIERAGVAPSDIAYLAAHQMAPWSSALISRFTGLSRAKHLTTFPSMGNNGASNIPLLLAMGEKENLLRTDDLVLLSSVAAGYTAAAIVMRWGT
jgi:3-oxoacyl-[acyl-carrier-protein] synthase-3